MPIDTPASAATLRRLIASQPSRREMREIASLRVGDVGDDLVHDGGQP
jgi:hypothetical protein